VTQSGELYAVSTRLGPALEVGIPKPLFTRPMQRAGRLRNRWVASADGERFLVNAVLERQAAAPFSIVLNWPAALGGE